MSSPDPIPREVSEEKVNSSSPLSTLSKALDAVQLAPNVAVESPAGGNSPLATVAVPNAVFNGMFDAEAPPQGPGLSPPLQIVNDDAYSPMPLAVSSDGCRSFNSSRVSANPPPEMPAPMYTLDFDRLFYGNDEAPSKDEVPDSAIVPSKIVRFFVFTYLLVFGSFFFWNFC